MNLKIQYFVLIVLIGLFSVVSYSQNIKRPVIALVLSGGGAKGFAHIGALKVLEEVGIPIDLIVGTSMGSIVGGLYSIGYTANEIETMAKSQDWGLLLSDVVSRDLLSPYIKIEKQRYVISLPVDDQKRPIVPLGAIKGQNIINLFSDLAGKVPVNADFSNLPINYACIGTDIETGKEIVIKNGFLPTAIYSSMAIPGVFLPGEHNGYTMIDGGVVNNFPTDVAKALGADIIIGVDLRNDLYTAKEIKSIQQLMNQLINFYSVEKDSINKSYCNVLIRPDITGYGVSNFSQKALDTLVKRGINAAQMAVPELIKLKEEYNLTPRTITRDFIKDEKWYITKINITGKYSINESLILDKINITIPGSYSYKEIKDAIDRVYGLGCISQAYFSMTDDVNGNIFNLNIEEKKVSNINVGLRLNTTEAVSILLNYTQRDYKLYIGQFSATADISSQPGFSIMGEISKSKLPVIGFQLDGKYRNYDIYYDGEKRNSAEIYYGAAGLYAYKSINNRATIGISLKEEFFKGNIFSNESDTTNPSTKTSISNVLAYYSFDNLDNFYYPSKGTELYAEASIIEDQEYNNLNPVALLKMRNFISLTDQYSILLNLYGRAVFSTESPLFKSNYIGGTDYSIYMSNHMPFYGIPDIMPSERFSFIGLTGIRLKIAQNHYFSLVGNYLLQNNDFLKVENYSFIWGVGISYSFNSMVGPWNLDIGYSDWNKKPTLAANIGFWF